MNRTRAHAVTPRCRRRHHASAVSNPRLPRGRVLILSPIHFVPSPSPSSEQSTRVTLAAARRAGADSGHLSPPCLDSSRCKPRNLALHLLRSISCSIEPSAGRNRSYRPRPPLEPRRAPPPLVEFHFPASLRSNRVAGELLRTPLFLPGLFPARIRRRQRRNAAAPPWPPMPPPLCRRGAALREPAGRLRAGSSYAAARPGVA